MHIGQFIILIGKLDAKRLRESIAEIVAGTGLQRLSIMHHGFDGIGRMRAGKFFFIGFTAFKSWGWPGIVRRNLRTG